MHPALNQLSILVAAAAFPVALVWPAASPAAGQGVAYVSNQQGGVNVIDLATLKSSGTIDIKGKSPRGIGITADGKMLITANKDDGNISVIDTMTGELVRHIAVGKNPEFVRVLGDKVFVSTEPSSNGGPPTPGEDEDDDDAEKIPARIAVVDLKLGKKLREIVGGPETEGIEFSADGKQLIITNEADNTLTVHSISTGKLLKTIPTGKYGDRPRGIKLAPDGKHFVATLEFGNKFLVLDKHYRVVKAVATGNAPYGISYDRSGKLIYVSAAKDKLLQVYDATSYKKVKEVATGNRCWHFSFTPDDRQLLLACGKSDSVLVFDVATLQKTGEVASTPMPWGIVTYPKAMGSIDAP